MSRHFTVARLCVLALGCLLLLSTLDHARGSRFAKVTVPPCRDDACSMDISAISREFVGTLDQRSRAVPGFTPFSDTNYCAASIAILGQDAPTERQLLIPTLMESRGIISIDEENGVTTIKPGPINSSWLTLTWKNLLGQGRYSCHMSDYSAAYYAVFIVLASSELWFGYRRRRKDRRQ